MGATAGNPTHTDRDGACPIAANAALLEVQPDRAVWFDPRAIAMVFAALSVLLGVFAWLYESWWPIWLLLGAGVLYAGWMPFSGDDRRRLREDWHTVPREWGSPAWYRYPDLGGRYVVLVGFGLLCLVVWLGWEAVFEPSNWPWAWAALAAIGPLLWLGWFEARARSVELQLGRRTWRAGQRRQVRLQMLDGALAFEAPRVWLRCLRRRGGARVEVEFEAVVPVGEAPRMAAGDELEFVVSIPTDARPREFTEDVLRWWELVVVGRRRGRRISWIFELPVE